MINNNKEKKVTTKPAPKKGATTVRLTAAQKAEEDRNTILSLLADHVEDEEIYRLNKRLHTPLPIKMPSYKFYGFWLNVEADLEWLDAPVVDEGSEYVTLPTEDEEAFCLHLEKAIAAAFKSFKPTKGKLTFKKVDVDFEEYRHDVID